MDIEETTVWLDKFIRKCWNQGDNYYVERSKNKTVWMIGYTNDYPLQHGRGRELRLPNDVVDFLIEHIKL